MVIYFKQNKILERKIYTSLVDLGFLASMDEYYRINGEGEREDGDEVFEAKLRKPFKINNDRIVEEGLSSKYIDQYEIKKDNVQNEKDKNDYFTKEIQESFDCCISAFTAAISKSNLDEK